VNDRGPRVNCDVLAPTSQLISGLNGPRIGSLDIVTPIRAPAPVVAARVFNDGGAAGTTGFTMSAAVPPRLGPSPDPRVQDSGPA